VTRCPSVATKCPNEEKGKGTRYPTRSGRLALCPLEVRVRVIVSRESKGSITGTGHLSADEVPICGEKVRSSLLIGFFV